MAIYEVITNEFNQQILKRNNEDGTTAWIPMVEDNSDYQRYLRWLENPEAEQSTPNLS
jgi:hypothetical protein